MRTAFIISYLFPERSRRGPGWVGENLHAVHNDCHRLIEVLVAIAEQDRSPHILGKIPQRDPRLGIDHHQSQLSEHWEFQSSIAEDPAQFKTQVGIRGKRHKFISSPILHRGVELVVRSVRAAVEDGLIDNILEAFSAGIRNEHLLGSGDLWGHWTRWRALRLLRAQ